MRGVTGEAGIGVPGHLRRAGHSQGSERGGRRSRACLRGMLLVLFLSLTWGSPTVAHEGGEEVFRGEAGFYFLQAYWLHMEETNFVAYTIGLREAETKRPVDDAEMTVTATTPAGILRPVQTQVFANQYQFFFRLEEPGTWQMEAEIDGRAGQGSLRHEMWVTEDPGEAAGDENDGQAAGAVASGSDRTASFLGRILKERSLLPALALLVAGLGLAVYAVNGGRR